MASFIWKAVLNRCLSEVARGPALNQNSAEDVANQTVDVGVVFAMGIEAGGFEDLLVNPTVVQGHRLKTVTGMLGERRVTFAVCGMGKAAARRGAEALVAGHRPRWVVSAGFSGGLH